MMKILAATIATRRRILGIHLLKTFFKLF